MPTSSHTPPVIPSRDQREDDRSDVTAASNAKSETANDVAGEERGGASGRNNAEYTAFVSNLPFNIIVEDLREKFKHVCTYMSAFYCMTLCNSHPSPQVCCCVCVFCPSWDQHTVS